MCDVCRHIMFQTLNRIDVNKSCNVRYVSTYHISNVNVKQNVIEQTMEYSDLDLEMLCQTKLRWPAHRVARTRPVDMRAAIVDFEDDEQTTIATILPTQNEEPYIEPPTAVEYKKPTGVETETPNVMLFSRTKRYAEHPPVISTPLLTPMATQSVTVMRPFMVIPPKKLGIVPIFSSGSNSDIEISIDRLVHRHAKFTKQLQEKRDLMKSIKDEMDLEETLLLETSTKYTTNRLDRTTVSIIQIKTQIEESINRKKKLLAVATESDDEDDKDQENEDEKRSQSEHMKRVSTIMANIDALENILQRLNV